jgi:hypothetical protein
MNLPQGELHGFENFIMSHPLKACHTWSDFGIGEFKLWYVRDREKREVDALITRDNKPWLLVEVKMNDLSVSKSLVRSQGCLTAKKSFRLSVLKNLPPGKNWFSNLSSFVRRYFSQMAGIISDHQLWGLRKALRRGLMVVAQPFRSPRNIFLRRDWVGSDTFSTKGYRLSNILPGIFIPQPACFNDT